MDIKTVKIRIWGIVQGVGFRPFVAKLADRLNIKGQVLNIGGLVDIVVTDTEARISEFIERLKLDKPEPSEIVHVKVESLDYIDFDDFEIMKSDEGGDEIAMIPADLAICSDCLNELFDEKNPRYRHPFISCMTCGPRYTIIDKIPYDRENTSMVDFHMCEFCAGEYTDREDRRYHAQTVSCHDCGPMLEYKLNELKLEPLLVSVRSHVDNKDLKTFEHVTKPLAEAENLLSRGETIALKGVGGYNFICDPQNDAAVKKLRKIKGREEKPFALMFKCISEIKQYCEITIEEENLLTSSARPIVLLTRKESNISKETYKNSRHLGAFLPSMGVQHLLLERISPLIVTSANLSDQMIITEDSKMFEFLKKEPLLAGVFYNERKIKIPLDDSVVRVIDNQPQMIRRSKGYAPVPLYIENEGDKYEIFATGGQLKSAFSLSKGSFAYVSQYFGDLETTAAVETYISNFERMKNLFHIDPKVMVYDMHPLYNTTRIAEDIEVYFEKSFRVQHHHAHIASVMAEHNLKGAVIGVAFDGTGYGDDGNIWGGEFLICEEGEYERVAHMEYVRMLGGDSSMKEGWKSAMSYMFHYENTKELEKDTLKDDEISLDISDILRTSRIKDNEAWPLVKAALNNNINVIKSSSMGRIFDAISSLLDIHHINSYEGECAVMLENAAFHALDNPGKDVKNDMALKFHMKIAQMILIQCKKIRLKYESFNELKKYNQVALSGGVFQNKILMEMTLKLLRESGFKAYYNISVPPNDGGIALGQNYIAMHKF